MKTEQHQLMGGKLHIYRRENSSKWQCATFLQGRNWRKSTGEESLSLAKEIAEDWYLTLKGKSHAGLLSEKMKGKKFKEAAAKFIEELPVLTQGQRSKSYIKDQETRLNAIILPFMGDRYLSDAAAAIAEFRVQRAKSCKTGKPPSRSTMHKDIVLIRQVFKTAKRYGWIEHLPDFTVPYKTSGKISHRAWFSPTEYKQLYEATRDRARHPRNERWRKASENMHDFVLFMVNTGLRPDEALRLEFRDVDVVTDEATGERILEIEVRGKRGIGYCKSMPGAVPFAAGASRAAVLPRPAGRHHHLRPQPPHDPFRGQRQAVHRKSGYTLLMTDRGDGGGK